MIELLSVVTWEITQNFQVFTAFPISDIVKLSGKEDTYALAIYNGTN